MDWPLPAGLTGTITIFAVIDPDGKLTEASKANNTVSKSFVILPRDVDETPPVISAFTVEGGANMTSDSTVNLSLLASDNVNGSGLGDMNLVDRIYNSSTRTFVTVKETGWKKYASSITFILDEQPGIHYLQAWVTDLKGNVSTMARVAINYNPQVSRGFDSGQITIFRLTMDPGGIMNLQITPQIGDADLYVWDQDGNLVAASLQADQTVEQVTFQTQFGGQYQVEVVAVTDIICTINLAVPLPDRLASAPAQVKAGEKVPRTNPAILTNNTPLETNPSTPATIAPIYMLHLPVLSR